MEIKTSYPHTDSILSEFKNVIGKDFDGYRNHVTRMLNFCHYLQPELTQLESQKLQIAAAFHDIALWTDDRVDYLVPSYQHCLKYLDKNALSHMSEEIQIIIDMHHLISSYKGPFEKLTETFRKADLVDFSFGIVKHGVDAKFIEEVKRALPNAGFHKTLMRFSLKQLSRKPWDPMPMLRAKNIYQNNSE